MECGGEMIWMTGIGWIEVNGMPLCNNDSDETRNVNTEMKAKNNEQRTWRKMHARMPESEHAKK